MRIQIDKIKQLTVLLGIFAIISFAACDPKSSEKSVSSYNYTKEANNALTETVIGEIDQDKYEVTATVPFGTDVTGLVADFEGKGKSVTISGTAQVSGETANDFTNPVVYTITAENGSTIDYTVIVTIAPRPWIGTQQIGGEENQTSEDIAIDVLGNLYMVGTSQDDLDDQTNSGSTDAFLVKYNASGERQWSRLLNTPKYSHETGKAAATDLAGNVYMTGITDGKLDGSTGASSMNTFLVKYNSEGEKQWVRQIDVQGMNRPEAMAADSDANIYIAGWTNINLDGNHPDTNGNDMFVVKYNSSGELQWLKQWGSPYGEEVATGITVDNQGNILICGASDGNLFATNPGEGYDLILIKLNGAGQTLWTKQFGTDTYDHAAAIESDTDGNLYLIGQANKSIDDQPYAGYSDGFLMKLNGSGENIWTRQFGSALQDYVADLAVDGVGHVYVRGSTNGDLAATNAGSRDLFVLKYTVAGEQEWAVQFGTEGFEGHGGIVTDAIGSPFVGFYSGRTFTETPVLGYTDTFLMKLNTLGEIQ